MFQNILNPFPLRHGFFRHGPCLFSQLIHMRQLFVTYPISSLRFLDFLPLILPSTHLFARLRSNHEKISTHDDPMLPQLGVENLDSEGWGLHTMIAILYQMPSDFF